MGIKLFLLIVTLFVCVLSAAGQTVVESESSIRFVPDGLEVILVVEKGAGVQYETAELSFLDPTGAVKTHGSLTIRLSPGKRAYKVTMPANGLSDAVDDIRWFRLRYHLGSAHGVVSLSQLIRNDFHLTAATFEKIEPGQSLRLRVRALGSGSNDGVRGVSIDATVELDLDTDQKKNTLTLKGSSVTDHDGLATIDLKVPSNIPTDGGEIKIVGRRDGIEHEITDDLDDATVANTLIITTDKPLYQPGQMFNARVICLSPDNTVVTGSSLGFSIADENDTVVYKRSAATSEFGIASISWQIPENAKLGGYHLTIESDDELRDNDIYFKVSRYDLPNFSVSTSPDKPFYLTADKTAQITVRADYLFGKPVTRGRVRVVAEPERHWNYREQKYESGEGTSVEGSADATGKFVASIDLTGDIGDLKDAEWERYRDLSFAAYFTDLTTNRTEQRSFDVRLSKEPIHVYFENNEYAHADLPLTGYVTTYYADGTPAACAVDLSDSVGSIAHVQTDSSGAARVETSIRKASVQDATYDLRITARDKRGNAGHFDNAIDLTADDVVQVETDKAIYKPGDMIEADVLSSRRSGIIYIDTVRNGVSLESDVVHLRGGRAHLSIPYKDSFRGELTIAAYSDQGPGYSYQSAGRGIIFPVKTSLDINAKFTKAEYRPGENAGLKFLVSDGSGWPVAGAIGLGIFDKAIEDRARTETEFGSTLSGFLSHWGYDRAFGKISIKQIEELDLSKPISPEMQRAAAIILGRGAWLPKIYTSDGAYSNPSSIYAPVLAAQLKPVKLALNSHHARTGDFPSDTASIRQILASEGIDLDATVDPWEQPYLVQISVERGQRIVTFRSVGPDKKPDTSDDIPAMTVGFDYFTRTGDAIDRSVREYHERTGLFIRDRATLATELARSNIDLDSLVDAWGHPYSTIFEVNGRRFVIRFRSLGPDGKPSDTYRSDDFDIWTTQADYFAETELRINGILDEEINVEHHKFPGDADAFRTMLRTHGVDIERIQDGYQRPVYLVAERTTAYTDKRQVTNGKTTITPVTEEMILFTIRGMGADRSSPTDDVNLAIFSGGITEAYKGTAFARAEISTIPFSQAKGAISGLVADPSGASIPGARIDAVDEVDETRAFDTTTNADGKFVLGNLPTGVYTVRVSSSGFTNWVYHHVAIRPYSVIDLNVTMAVGSVSAVVTVTSTSAEMMATTSNAASVVSVRRSGSPTITNDTPRSTPRLRQYFPETLVWQPEILTDKKGRAEVNFKMADNITTWKMFAIASTKNGKVGLVEKEIPTFQPFFVDFDPPRFLTAGDEVSLPAQVRNYTDRKQNVDVTMDKGDWFDFLNPAGSKQHVTVESGSSQNAIFGIKASVPVISGKQRITVIADNDSDAIEKPLTVRPNGEEIVRTDDRVSRGSTKLNLTFPENALPGTPSAELKVYPNLLSHVSESMDGILQRPYGCGEQTISSTYPDLMIVKVIKGNTPLRQKAARYLQTGYERLIGYQSPDGGFSYWGAKDRSDVALTAYAVRFLIDAAPYISVDESIIRKAEDWLVKQQRADGSWTTRYSWETTEVPARTKLLTSYVARSLAMSATHPISRSADVGGKTLSRTFEYLRSANAEIDDPYAMALFGLASLDAGDAATAQRIATSVASMAIREGDLVYWKLETNTPFYGWGTAGRIETTALVTQLLTRTGVSPELSSKGLLFLLRSKDRYGVWYSAQATVNVLDTLLSMLSDTPAQPQNVTVRMNRSIIFETTIEPDRVEPITIDLTGKLTGGVNPVEIDVPGDVQLMTELVARHYIDWRDSTAADETDGPARALKLGYQCDNTAPAIMADVTCTVDADRVGFRGYGMLLAEIGTPPGADVSRESLEAAMAADASLSHYEILPDRIVLYMWAIPGGTHFRFKFRPRYGINAQTPASVLYDYYNPEARATARPMRFRTT